MACLLCCSIYDADKKGTSPPVMSTKFISQEAKRRRLQGRKVSAREKELMHRAFIAGVHAGKFRKKSHHRSSRSATSSSGVMASLAGPSRLSSSSQPFLGSPTVPPTPTGFNLMSPPMSAPGSRSGGGNGNGNTFDEDAFDLLSGLGEL